MPPAVVVSRARSALARHLVGEGIEVAAGGPSFPLPMGVSVRNADLDVVADPGVEGLVAIADRSEDFVVASHALGHAANPIKVIDEIHRVLRDGGVTLIVLPDRTTTVNGARAASALADVIADYRRDALTAAGPAPADLHGHVWSQSEFWPVMGFGIEALGHRWEHVDGFATDDPAADGLEFGFVVRKGLPGLAMEVRLHRWYADVAAWDAAQPHELVGRLEAARRDAAAVRQSTSWRVTAPLRSAADSARRMRARFRARH